MASWTDKTSAFNPYVKQLPIETMMAVGMQKQQQYDLGIQKIQSSIDKVAGLDIMKSEDKQYLESKLSELGKNLHFVAAGDFSDSQLVNSIGGMVGKLGRDETVQTAVISTSKARKELSLLDNDRKEGKLSPSNELFFTKQFNSWYNDGQVGTSFNGRYIPNFDIDKLMRETFASLKEDGYSLQQVFQTDANGNILTKKTINPVTGKVQEIPVYSSVMSELKRKGLFPEKVNAAIEQVFNDPRVVQQLQIDGEYNYRNQTPESLATQFEKTKISRTLQIDEAITEAEMKLKLDISTEEKEEINKQIEKLNAAKLSTVETFDSLIQRLSDNPDAVRGYLHREEEKSRFATMYTNVVEDRDLKVNPYWETAFKEMEFQEETRRFNLNYSQRERHHNDEMAAKAKEKETAIEPLPTYEGEDPNPKATIELFKNDGIIKSDIMRQTVDDFLFSSGAIGDKYVKKYMSDPGNAGLTEQRAREIVINLLARTQNMTPDQYRFEQYKRGATLYNSNPSKRTKELEDKYISASNSIKNYNEYITIRDEVFKQVPKGVNAKVVTLPNGTQIVTGLGEYESDVEPRLAAAIQDIYYKDPKLGKSILTGESKVDGYRKEALATFVDRYQSSKSQETSKFNAQEAMNVINDKTKGSIKIVGEKDPKTGQIKSTIKFIGEGGVSVSEMVITEEEAAVLGQNVRDWWQDPEVRNAEMRIKATKNRTTSYSGDIDKTETYLSDDVFYLKSDFPLLKGIKYDVKANIAVGNVVSKGGETSQQYYIYLYINDGKPPYVYNLPISKNSMSATIEFLNQLTPAHIDKILSTRK